ncbi:MAG: TIGR04282 family arsenosugar biosynthesis glycosyltransferase [Algoriphagus sp.]|jgi:rSAM/selenodomain-associated transferase 1|nr:TIGR04282 family arsenosugar biosynthesis glycosyltransferase [Algoriphagus sp.]MCE2779325.1 TIGR04282 family arsenosugar biosynthesis glycosyltransferase [Algoriphagus sp.]
MKKEVVLVFQRNEVLGKVKTRLAAGVGEEQAMEIYRYLLNKTYLALKEITVPVTTYFSEFIPENPIHSAENKQLQLGGDLGERMRNAFVAHLESGMEKVVLIGTDCPSMEGTHIVQAFEALEHSELVLGPARDGGYYLIGMKRRADFLFEGITWSSELVLSQTLTLAAEQGLRSSLLPILEDIDSPEDWERYCSQNGDMPYLSSSHQQNN